MSWPHGSTEIDERSQNNNMFASKSALQSNKGGSQGDRFPLYVTNIPVDMDEDQLKEMFSKAGNVIHAKCLPPKEGRNSKVGFVTFPTEEEAELAISIFKDHQTITVDYTKSFKEQRAQNAGKSDSPFSSGNKGPSLFSGNNNAANPGAMSSFGARKSPQQSNLNGPSGIGRGIHYDNEAESQPGSMVNGQTQRLFNVAPGTPAQGQVGKQDSSSSSNHTMYGQSDNQNNLEATPSDSTYENFSPAAEIPTQPTDQISYQSNVNTMANGFSSMYLTQSADQVQMSDGQNEQQSNQNQYGYSQSYDANEQQSNQHQYGYSQSYDANQAYNENQTYVANDQNQAYDPNQTDEQNPAYGHSQSQDPNQAYDPSQAYGENAAYTQNQSQAYEESQVYDPNAAYYQSQSYEKNQSYDPNQAFTQNQTYGETPTYEQNQAYSENQSYNQNQTYDQTQQYDQAYAQEQGYGQNQWYGQNQSYDGNQAYDQNTAYDPNQAYGHNQAYSQETYDKDQIYDQKQSSDHQPIYDQKQSNDHQPIYDQKQSNDHQPIYDQKQADDQNKTHDQNHAYDPSNESPASAQYETPKQNRSFDQMFAGMSKAGDGQQQSFGQNQFQVSSRLPKSNNDSGGKTCHNCGQPGHFSRECPTKKSPGGACHRCGESGHFARECPSSGGSSGGGGTCHNCGQPGHFSRECPSKSSGGGSCHKRGEQGHFARECPQSDQGTCPRPEARVDYVPPPLPEDVDTLFKSAVHKGINFDRFDNIPVEVTGNKPPAAIQTFDELLLPDTLKSNIARAEFTKPTPVQKYGMPIILTGRDIMACAQTGSGKTIAFLLPVMAGMVNNRLAEASYLGGDAPCPAALCVAPTRELAYQIFTEALKFSTGTYLRPVVCYGGVSVSHQLGKLERGCHILIGTPGRLIDFAGRNKVSFSNVRYLILDEADRMLEMGFEYDIRKIITQFGMPEKTQRQTLMFSATFPDEIQKLAREYLNDYLFLAVGSVGGTNLDIKQEVLDVQGTQKRSVLMEILGQSGGDKTLVFVERKRNADFLASWLSQNQCAATSISGDRSQQERESALRDFRAGVASVLIATSVAARGLDIPDVKHVINYDLPQQIEEYVHRIGRTGRIGNQGRASAFFERGKDDKLARSLVKVLADALQDVPNWLEEVAERALGTNYGPAGGKFASRDTRQFERRNAGGGPPSTGNVSRQTTNVSLVNTSLGRQQNEDEEEWE